MRERDVALTRFLQVGMVGLLLVGVHTRNPGAVVNAVLALGVTVLPAVLARDWDVHLGSRLTAYVTLAVFLHALGMVGPYETVPWWDSVTHTLSATVVAAVGYATARAFDEHSDAVTFPPEFLFWFVVLVTLALGVLWEVLEFAARQASLALGVDAVLVQYGLEDTLTDLLFDAVGAVVVGLFGRRQLRPVVESIRARLAGQRGEHRGGGGS